MLEIASGNWFEWHYQLYHWYQKIEHLGVWMLIIISMIAFIFRDEIFNTMPKAFKVVFLLPFNVHGSMHWLDSTFSILEIPLALVFKESPYMWKDTLMLSKWHYMYFQRKPCSGHSLELIVNFFWSCVKIRKSEKKGYYYL